MAKIISWNLEKGFGFLKLDDGREAFVHVSAITPRQPRGKDLRGTEIEVMATSKGPKGLRVDSALTREEWERREAQRSREAAEVQARAVRALTTGEDGFLRRGGLRVTDWSMIRLVQRHKAGRPDRIDAAEVSSGGYDYVWAKEPLSDQQIDELIVKGLLFRRTCSACRQQLLTTEPDRQVHGNGYCDEGDQLRRWSNLTSAVAAKIGALPEDAEFGAGFNKPLTLEIRVGEQIFSSEELLAGRCPKCGDRLEVVESEEGTKFDICVFCGWKTKRFPAVRLVHTVRGGSWWEVHFRDPTSGGHDKGFGYQIDRYEAVSDDYVRSYPDMETRQQLVQILQEAGASEEIVAVARPVPPDPNAPRVCPECGAPVVQRTGGGGRGRYYSYTLPGTAHRDSDGDTWYEPGLQISTSSEFSYWLCPNGHGRWEDEHKVLNPNR